MPWLLPGGHRGRGLCDEGGYRGWLRHIDGVAGGTSVTVAPARPDMVRCADGGIILFSVVSRYQLGLARHSAGRTPPASLTRPRNHRAPGRRSSALSLHS